MHLLVPQTLEGAGAVWSFKSAKDGVRNRSGRCTHSKRGLQPNFLNVRQNQPPLLLLTILAVGTDFLCFTALLSSDTFVAAFTAEKKGLRFSGLWCLAN